MTQPQLPQYLQTSKLRGGNWDNQIIVNLSANFLLVIASLPLLFHWLKPRFLLSCVGIIPSENLINLGSLFSWLQTGQGSIVGKVSPSAAVDPGSQDFWKRSLNFLAWLYASRWNLNVWPIAVSWFGWGASLIFSKLFQWGSIKLKERFKSVLHQGGTLHAL